MPSAPSYVHGTSPHPLRPTTVHQVLAEAASNAPDGLALVASHQGVRWSWSVLRARVANAAARLLGIGLEPGDRIGILAPNRAEWVVAQFAAAEAGLVLVNLNPAYRAPELEHALAHAGCRALITQSAFKSSRYLDMLRQICPELDGAGAGALSAARLPALRQVVVLDEEAPAGTLSWRALEAPATDAERARLTEVAQAIQFDDVVNIQFTSGTTGHPKAATLTHHNIVNNAWLVGERMALGRDDRLCIPVPLYHCFGMVMGTLTCAVHGATMVLPSAGFDAHAALQAMSTERCTAVHGVPTMFIAFLDDPDFARLDLSALRTGIMAGAPCPVELMQRVMHDMHLAEITIAYGMTETGPVSFQTAVDDPVQRRVETVGRVLPHTEVKIVDGDRRVIPRGETGELLTRGYCVMPGYWADPERTAQAIDAAGWIASGDLAVIDDEGYCRIVGRTKDMLIRGGENIYPREIEEVLYTHPKVDQAEVIGVPDPRYGEEVCAWVKLRAGETCSEEELRAFCRERMAHFKVPRYLRFVDAFPTTVTGKVQKFAMRELMRRELAALEEAAR
ncbi:MAG: AMP-binding protein [Chromatiales bacterium]|nr:AMP-binding protein [Chromatiales bacterium]